MSQARHPSDFHNIASDPKLAIAEALSLLERIAVALEAIEGWKRLEVAE